MTTVHGILLILLSLASTAENVLAERIPSDIKQIVTFVYVEQEKPKDKALSDRLRALTRGTGTRIGPPGACGPKGTPGGLLDWCAREFAPSQRRTITPNATHATLPVC